MVRKALELSLSRLSHHGRHCYVSNNLVWIRRSAQRTEHYAQASERSGQGEACTHRDSSDHVIMVQRGRPAGEGSENGDTWWEE